MPEGERAAIEKEVQRLRVEREQQADAQRRSFWSVVRACVTLVVFALAPLAPGARRWFGDLTAPFAIAIMLPGFVALWINHVLFRRLGFSSRVYIVSDFVETVALYGTHVAYVFFSGITWSVLWVVCGYSALFFGAMRPFRLGFTAGIMFTVHGIALVAYLAVGNPAGASAAVAVGVAVYALYLLVARDGRTGIRLEAERNVLRSKLSEELLTVERERIARALRDGIGAEILALVRQLDREEQARSLADVPMAKHARSIFDDLAQLVRSPLSDASEGTMSLADLSALIRAKCRGLSEVGGSVSYEEPVAVPLTPHAARALLRVAQELVRNAVSHGPAAKVLVELSQSRSTTVLTVRDDGRGLSTRVFESASGGIRNARTWLGEVGGTLELVPQVGGATGSILRATIPTGSSL